MVGDKDAAALAGELTGDAGASLNGFFDHTSGRLFPEYRPANSPTFSPLLHSNSHRRVMEMRLQSEEDASAASRVNAKARRAERAAARLAGKDKK
uniref:Uncharacterized protein n=1 Tax=Oryza barthii TaxID=65489 RepID=A0A0D3FDQ7_9ORYZ